MTQKQIKGNPDDPKVPPKIQKYKEGNVKKPLMCWLSQLKSFI